MMYPSIWFRLILLYITRKNVICIRKLTKIHELVHSTRHASRLHREGIAEANRSDAIKYSKEELIAEMGASFLCAMTGIGNDNLTDNAAAYIRS